MQEKISKDGSVVFKKESHPVDEQKNIDELANKFFNETK